MLSLTCHVGVINQYLAHVLGIETQMGLFYPHYTSIHRVMAARSGDRMIVSVNEAAHLRGMACCLWLWRALLSVGRTHGEYVEIDERRTKFGSRFRANRRDPHGHRFNETNHQY